MNSMISHRFTPIPRRYLPVLTVILVCVSWCAVSAQAASTGDTSSSDPKSWLGGVDSLHKKGETYPEFTRSTIMTKKSISTITISPTVTTDTITISLDAMSAVSVLIRLYTPTGEAVSNLWLGKLHSGINTLAIDLPDSIASGSYLLAVEGDDGKPLIYSAFVRKK